MENPIQELEPRYVKGGVIFVLKSDFEMDIVDLNEAQILAEIEKENSIVFDVCHIHHVSGEFVHFCKTLIEKTKKTSVDIIILSPRQVVYDTLKDAAFFDRAKVFLNEDVLLEYLEEKAENEA